MLRSDKDRRVKASVEESSPHHAENSYALANYSAVLPTAVIRVRAKDG